MTQTMMRIEEPEIKLSLRDTLNGIGVAQENAAVKFLPASMKDLLVKSVNQILYDVCEKAWSYYTDHDVPLEHESLLRVIVEYHYCKGADLSAY